MAAWEGTTHDVTRDVPRFRRARSKRSGTGAEETTRSAVHLGTMKNQSLPLWPLAVLSLFAVGCTFHAFGGSDIPVKKKSMKFQVDPGPLEAPTRWAAKEWSNAVGKDIVVSNEDGAPIFFTDASGCPAPEGTTSLACSLDMGTPDARIQVWEDGNPAYFAAVILHEMGHHLRQDAEHLKAPTNAVLLQIPDWKLLSTLEHPLTREDISFICEKFDCASINV